MRGFNWVLIKVLEKEGHPVTLYYLTPRRRKRLGKIGKIDKGKEMKGVREGSEHVRVNQGFEILCKWHIGLLRTCVQRSDLREMTLELWDIGWLISSRVRLTRVLLRKDRSYSVLKSHSVLVVEESKFGKKVGLWI